MEVEKEVKVPERKSMEEKLWNIIAELEGRIEVLEDTMRKVKSGLPQIGF